MKDSVGVLVESVVTRLRRTHGGGGRKVGGGARVAGFRGPRWMAPRDVASRLCDGVVGGRTVGRMAGVEGVGSGGVGLDELMRQWRARGLPCGRRRGFLTVVVPVVVDEGVRERASRRVDARRGEIGGGSAEWGQRRGGRQAMRVRAMVPGGAGVSGHVVRRKGAVPDDEACRSRRHDGGCRRVEGETAMAGVMGDRAAEESCGSMIARSSAPMESA